MGGYFYTTKAGDMWDYIAYQVYGDDYMVDILYKANPEYLDIYIFDDGYQIWCPEADAADDDQEGNTLPEWRDEEEPDVSDEEDEDEE